MKLIDLEFINQNKLHDNDSKSNSKSKSKLALDIDPEQDHIDPEPEPEHIDPDIDPDIDPNLDVDLDLEKNATITYDDYYFDIYNITCDNKNCTTKDSPCGLFINEEISLCFCCYIKGYRICLLSHDIDLVENMIEFKPKMYKLNAYCNYLLPFE
jgi:hypothetical protein